MKTVFVTGATGALGKHVVPRLIRAGYNVYALSRNAENHRKLSMAGAHPAEADLFDRSSLLHATTSCDAILHLATHIPVNPSPKRRDWKLNDRIRTEGAANLLYAAEKNGIPVFIQPGIVQVYGDLNGARVSAHTPISRRLPYQIRSAVIMEKKVREAVNYGVHSVILRFGVFYGPDTFHTQQLLSNIRSRKMPLIGEGSFYMNMIHVEDAAAVIVTALTEFPKFKGRTWNVSDFQPKTYRELLSILQTELKAPAPRKLPGWLVRLLIGKATYGYLTNSIRVYPEGPLLSWSPRHPDFAEEIRKMLPQEQV